MLFRSLEQISWVAPARWGFAAVASTANLNVIEQLPQALSGAAPSGSSATPTAAGSSAAGPASEASEPTDPLWNHTPSTWLTDMGLLVALGLVFSGLAWRRLLKIKPGRRR